MVRFAALARRVTLRAVRLVPRAALARTPAKVLRADLAFDFTLRRTDAAPDFTRARTLRVTDLASRSATAPARRTLVLISSWLGAFLVTLSTFAATLPSVEPIERATSVKMLWSLSAAINILLCVR